MCIRHHTHYSVESVAERGAAGPSLSSVCGRGRRVVETWTSHMSVQGIEDRGHRSRWSDVCFSETPTAQYIIYNIKRAVWKTHVVQRKKHTMLNVSWSFLFTSPAPPRKKHPRPTQNVSPSNFPSPVRWPRDRSHSQSPSTNPVYRTPGKGFTPRTSQRTRVVTIKNTDLKSSCHRTGTTTVMCPKSECDLRYQRIPPGTTKDQILQNKQEKTFPHQAQPGRVPASWVKTILSLDPVRDRGLTTRLRAWFSLRLFCVSTR
jgi:hypothetical protein